MFRVETTPVQSPEVEAVPNLGYSWQLVAIFDSVRSFVIAVTEDPENLDPQVEAIINMTNGMSNYKKHLDSHTDIRELIDVAATDSFVTARTFELILDGKNCFEPSDLTPDLEDVDVQEAIIREKDELIHHLERITSLPAIDIFNGNHHMDARRIASALRQTHDPVTQTMEAFQHKMIENPNDLLQRWLKSRSVA